MSKRDSYAVRISGLGEGVHDFSFELDKQFFVSFEHPDIDNGNVHAEVALEKKTGHFGLHFSLEGELEVVCDRCLDKFMIPISSEQTLFIKTGEETGELDDDVLVIGRSDHEIEIGQYLYEFTILALPVQKLHPEDADGKSTCNPDMLNQLEEHGSFEQESNEETDPRWDALKDIISKKK